MVLVGCSVVLQIETGELAYMPAPEHEETGSCSSMHMVCRINTTEHRLVDWTVSTTKGIQLLLKNKYTMRDLSLGFMLNFRQSNYS